MLFTMTYQANTHPRTQVLVQEFTDLNAAIEKAQEFVASPSCPAVRVLIRLGDAAHTDPIVWDSSNHKVHELINQAIGNRIDNMISDMAIMQTRMLALKEDIHNLLGTNPKV